MSIRKTSKINCPKCGTVQDFETWPSLNVDLHPEQKERLLSGELMRFTCGKCGESSRVNYPLLYHDMTKKLMVHFTANTRTEVPSTPVFERMMDGYQLRIVTTCNQLLEKVWISCAGLDDRLVELFKITMEQQMNPGEDGELWFAGHAGSLENREVLRFMWVMVGRSETYSVPVDSFHDFCVGISKAIELGDPKLGEWLTIDRRYAQEIFNTRFPED